MTAVAFDTLAYAKKLKAVGFTEQQAEVQAESMAEVIDSNLVTKADLLATEERINQRIDKLTYALQELNYKTTIRLGSMLVVAVGVLAAIIKF